MRGKGRTTRPAPARARITPAYAGKSLTIPKLTTRSWDHPRVCGEKGPQTMKGGHCARITPAYAGESTCNTVGRQHRGEHPRVCGEKPKVMNLVLVRPGSPPHVRGKAFLLTPAMVLSRITPACAGKSWSNALPCSRREDHPRVCGEKFFAAYGAMPLSGSPPRMRGKD